MSEILLYIVTYLLSIIYRVKCLEITDLAIPSYSEEGENVTFFCHYKVERSKLAELDIKWYLGRTPSPFMVFLPHLQKQPQVVDPRFREKIVFSEGMEGSGFTIVNITQDMSGLYTCQASTNTQERRRRKRIIIYSKYTERFKI